MTTGAVQTAARMTSWNRCKERVMYRSLKCQMLLCVLLGLAGCTERFDRYEQPKARATSTAPLDSTARAYPLLTIEEVYNGKLHVDTVSEVVHVRARIPEMKAGDQVWIVWLGKTGENTPVQTATGSDPLEFELPVAWLESSVGRTVDMHLNYKINGTGKYYVTRWPFMQVIDGESVFSVDGVVDNNLYLRADESTARVHVRYPGMQDGDTVKVHWVGTQSHSTATQTVSGTKPRKFDLPRAWLQESQGTRATLYYTRQVGGAGPEIRSENISVSIVPELFESGRFVAAGLNNRYRGSYDDCNGKAAYFCSGVFMRTTGAKSSYHAWDPSPTSIAIGGISFSYVREDLGIRRFLRSETQGIIFKNSAANTYDGQLDVKVLCSYPSDAATDARRAEKGCGEHSSYPGTSEECYWQNPSVYDVESWKKHYNAVGGSGNYSQRNLHQCSFRADAEEFLLSLRVRNHFLVPSQERPYHNEVMLETWPTGTTTALPLEAVFYLSQQTREVGLAGAQFIQRDYFNVTGQFLPLIRVDLNAELPFSFHPSEQGITPPVPETAPTVTRVRDSNNKPDRTVAVTTTSRLEQAN